MPDLESVRRTLEAGLTAFREVEEAHKELGRLQRMQTETEGKVSAATPVNTPRR